MAILEARLHRFMGGDHEEPSELATVLVDNYFDDDTIVVSGSDITINGNRYNVYAILVQGDSYESVWPIKVRSFELILFGYVGSGVWYKHKAVCRVTQ
jgi:phage-related protein